MLVVSHTVEHLHCQSCAHRVHRVATATFWRTFHHDGKICPFEGGGCTTTPFLSISTIMYKFPVCAPAERADTGRYTPYISTLLLYMYVLCGCALKHEQVRQVKMQNIHAFNVIPGPILDSILKLAKF
jgi:hypothetical protein